MFQQLYQKLIPALESRGIDYMVIGGQAVLVYGEPRLTQDIDITLGVGIERLKDILSLIVECGWQWLVDDPLEFVRSTYVLPCLDPNSGLRIDFIFSYSLYEQQALQRIQEISLGGVTVRFASIEDLLIHKIVSGRARDWEDVRILLVKNRQIDLDYLRYWLAQYDSTLEQTLLSEFEQLWKQVNSSQRGTNYGSSGI